jgi:hypothetical protein
MGEPLDARRSPTWVKTFARLNFNPDHCSDVASDKSMLERDEL